MESDLGESRNLAKVHPEKVAEMRRLMRAIEEARLVLSLESYDVSLADDADLGKFNGRGVP